MGHIYLFLADGFEEVEALGTVDVLRRAGLPVKTVSIMGRRVSLAFSAAGRPLAAICAAPMVYGKLGLLKDKKATCYPGFEKYLEGATPTGALVEQDANFITGKGPGATFEFAMAIVAKFCGKAKVAELKQGMILG